MNKTVRGNDSNEIHKLKVQTRAKMSSILHVTLSRINAPQSGKMV